MSLKIIFAGTPCFAAVILEKLIHSDHELKAVYTQPDRPKGRGRELAQSPVKKLASLHKLPIFQPESLKNETEQAILKEIDCDVMIVAAYGLILPAKVLEIPRLGCINVHASLLPKYRGASPIQYAILENQTETGITIMQMDKGLDTGDILLSKALEIHSQDNLETLSERLSQLAGPTLLESLSLLEAGLLIPKKQDNSLSSLAPKINKKDALIDWHNTSIQISQKIKAFNPWPVAFTYFNNEMIRIFKAQIYPYALDIHLSPGALYISPSKELIIGTGEGLLKIDELQLSGGKRLASLDFLNAKQKNITLHPYFK
ncbi:MAG: fmt [Francisellaceae bacterium]|nr:fmt [Francisellaceae bacterium]